MATKKQNETPETSEPEQAAPAHDPRVDALLQQLEEQRAQIESLKAAAAVSQGTGGLTDVDLAAMDAQRRKSKIETVDFWLTQTRYLHVVGESGPVLIRAAPDMPVKVTLPKYVMRQKREMITDGKGRTVAGQPLVDDDGEPVMERLEQREDPPFLVRVRPPKPIVSHQAGKPQHPGSKRLPAPAADDQGAVDLAAKAQGRAADR